MYAHLNPSMTEVASWACFSLSRNASCPQECHSETIDGVWLQQKQVLGPGSQQLPTQYHHALIKSVLCSLTTASQIRRTCRISNKLDLCVHATYELMQKQVIANRFAHVVRFAQPYTPFTFTPDICKHLVAVHFLAPKGALTMYIAKK